MPKKTHISAITVMESLGVSGEIQKIFKSQWAYSKDFLIACKTLWVKAIKILARLSIIDWLRKNYTGPKIGH